MGCASSAPLVEQGKNLVEGVKETASDAFNKGEKAVHDTTDTVKDGLSSGMDTVKETVQTAVNTAEESIGSVAHKIGETFNFTTSKTAESLTNNIEETRDKISSVKDDVVASASDNAAEVVSEAETVVMSETEHIREAFQSGTTPFFDTVRSVEDDMDRALKDLETHGTDAMEHLSNETNNMGHALEESINQTINKGAEVLEDIENVDHETEGLMLGENVKKAEKMVEELHGENDETSKNGGEEETQVHKEESAPTFWEAAADAILMKKTLKNFETSNFGQERIFFTPKKKADQEPSEKSLIKENDLNIENTEHE